MSSALKRPINWSLVGYFLFLAGVILVGIFLPPDDRICSATLLGQSAKEANTLVFGCAEFWLNRYQALIAALLALLAAGVSVFYLRRQIEVTERQEEDRFARRNAAARAILQISLSAICSYGERSAKDLEDKLTSLPSHGYASWTGTSPHIETPESAIEQIKGLIETIDVAHINAFSDLIGKLQVHDARRENLNSPNGVSRYNLEHYILDAAEIYSRAGKLFSYARRAEESPTSVVDVDDVLSAIRILQVEFDGEIELRQRLSHRFPAASAP